MMLGAGTYSLRDMTADFGNVRRLATVRGITPEAAADLVLRELGWEHGIPTRDDLGLRMHRQEEHAYFIAKSINNTAEELGAPMEPLRLLECGA